MSLSKRLLEYQARRAHQLTASGFITGSEEGYQRWLAAEKAREKAVKDQDSLDVQQGAGPNEESRDEQLELF